MPYCFKHWLMLDNSYVNGVKWYEWNDRLRLCDLFVCSCSEEWGFVTHPSWQSSISYQLSQYLYYNYCFIDCRVEVVNRLPLYASVEASHSPPNEWGKNKFYILQSNKLCINMYNITIFSGILKFLWCFFTSGSTYISFFFLNTTLPKLMFPVK